MTTESVKVIAMMTAPRYENTWARNNIERALSGAGIPLTVSGGVFYGQCMQTMMEQAIEQGVEYALTIDFDSVFTKKHIEQLLSRIVFSKEIDAIAPLQCKRGCTTPLASMSEETTIETNGEPIKVRSAHFGLTAIDLHKLANMPKPWFVSVPDENGSWGDNKTDDDIYFWRKWEEAGNSVYIDPFCSIGHMEEVVTQFQQVDGQMRPVHIYPKDWIDNADSI